MKADDFLADAPSVDDFLGEPDVKPARRGRLRTPYVAQDNPDNPIIPTGGSVLQDVQMAVPSFTEDRQNRRVVNRAIKANTPTPRGPRPERDMKGIAQDIYSILGNTGVQLVKPFVDIPNIATGGALDPAVRFLNNAGQAANLAASPTTKYDRKTLSLMPEGASLDKVGQLLTNPGLAANMGIPSVASMAMPLGYAKGMSALFPRAAAALGPEFQTANAVTANALMNAGDTFGQTEANTGGRLLAALGAGVSSALVGKATKGGLEGQLARGGKVPTWGAAFKEIGNDSLQEGGENFGNQLAQDTGEGKPLNFGAALDQAAIGATLAPFVSGPINVAGVATSPERRNARLLSEAINGFDPSVLFPNAMDNAVRQPGPRFDPVAAAAANMQPPAPAPAPIPQLGYDPSVRNQAPAIAVDPQGNARPMSADEFLSADTQRQEQENLGLTPDVQRAIAARNVSPQPEAPNVPSDLLQRLKDSGWTPPAPASEGNNPNPDPQDVQAIAADLERQYQQDVKDGIKQRLGLDQPPAEAPAPAKPASYAESPFLREMAARGGVNIGERNDTGVDPKRLTSKGKVMPAPYNIGGKPLFRPDGLRGDQLVESLVSQGYLTQAQVDEADAGGVGGSDQLAYDLIRKELESPGSVKPIDMQGDTAQQAMQQRASYELDSKARSIGLDTKGLSDDLINLALKRIERRLARSKGRADVSREVKAERETMDDVAGAPDYNYDDSDIPWDEPGNMSEAEAMRALGFTDQEIQDAALANRPSPAQARPEDASQTAPNEPAGPPGPAPADARGEGRQQQAGAQPEGLTSYTADELRQRDQRIAEQARAEERRKADEEARAQADSQRGEFALTGSDRPADVAAAGGQTDIFSQPAQPDVPTAPAPRAAVADAPKPQQAPATRLTDAGDSTPDTIRADGMSANDAAIAAVDGQIVAVQGLLGDATAKSEPAKSTPASQSATAIRSKLSARFGDTIARMEARGFLKIWDSAQQFNDSGQASAPLEGSVQGYWDGKTAHLFADALPQGDEVAVFLHEVGEHASMEDMLGPNAYQSLVRRAYDLVDQGDPVAERAMNRIPDDTPNQYVDSELLAYMIETVAADGAKAAPGARKWLSDIVAAIRAWWSQTGLNKLLDRYGKGIELTPADIAALAVRAVKWQAEQGAGSGSGGKASEAQAQTDTPAFRAWFGDSKVVDAEGKPLVVYHGTKEDFSEFRRTKSGEFGPAIYLTDNPREASEYGDGKGWGGPSGTRVMPLYAAITNPYTKGVDAFWGEFGSGKTDADAVAAAQAAGYDGIIAKRPDRYYDNAAHEFVDRGGELTHFIAFDPAQVKSATGNNGQFDPKNPDIRYSRPSTTTQAAAAAARVFGGGNVATGNPQGASAAAAAPWSVVEPGRLDNLIRRLQDNRIDIKRTVDAIHQTGAQIDDEANPYLMDELYIGKVRAQIDRLADEQVKPLLAAISNSGFTPEQVNEYLWARHAEERNRQMAKVNAVPFTQALDLAGMSTTDAQAKLQSFAANPDFAKMQRIAKMVDAITRDARTRIVTDGLEDPSVIQAWEGAYKNYVPLQRDMEESGGKASGYNVKGSESRRAVGSKKEAINILANVIAQAEATIIRSEKATVGRSVLDMARQHPNKDFWTVDTPPTERVIDQRTGLVTTKVKANYKALDNVFTVKEAGVEHFVVFNEDNARAVQFVRSLKNMDAAELGPVMEVIAKGTRYLAQWVTSRNPFFWMTNFARDLQGVAFNLQSTPLKGLAPQVMANIPDALGGFARLNMKKKTGKWTVMAQRFKDTGGQTGYMEQYRDSVQRMGDIIKEVSHLEQSRADPRRIGRAVLDVLEAANDTIENGVRLAVFSQGIEEGLSDAQSASIAKNISVNFNRKGNATGVYNALYMFMNANIQGNVRMIQGVMQSRRAQFYAAALTAAGAAVAMMNLTAGGDDDDTRKKRYELVPEWERERNWIVFIPGTDNYVKVPLPLGPHVLFNAGRILAELGIEEGADPFEKAASFASSMMSAFNPIGGGFPTPDAKGLAQLATPTLVRPIVDTVLNQNFAGIPIARDANPWGYNKPAYTLGRENTPTYWTTAAKAMNDWTGGDNVKPGKINLAPEQLAYLLKSYVVPGVAQTADKVAGQVMSHKDTPVDQIVGVSKFFGRIDDNERRRAGYEALRNDEQRVGEYKLYLKAGEKDKAREVLSKWGGGDETKGRKLMGQYIATDKLLSAYRKQKKLAGEEKLDNINTRIDRTLAVYQANTKDLRKK